MSDLVERLRSGEDGLEYAAADELDAICAENARLREALQHADAALDSLMSDEMPYTESCRIWRTAVESIRAALEVKP